MGDNLLDFSLDHWGPATEAELYFAVREADERRLERFLEAYRVFAAAGTTTPPRLAPGCVRPYLPYVDQPDWTVGGLQLDFDTLQQEGDEWKLADAIKHRLLYCHSIALDDPVGHLVAVTTAKERSGQGDSGRNALLRFMNFLLHLAPLLRDDVVCLLPNRGYLADRAERDKKRDALAAALSEVDGVNFGEFVDAAPESLVNDWKSRGLYNPELLAQTARSLASLRIATGLSEVLTAPQKLSLYLPFEADIGLVTSGARVSRDLLESGFAPTDNWLMNELVRLEMPGVGDLNPSELVAIRSGSEFATWRQVLSDGLRDADSLPTDTHEMKEAKKRAVREHLEAGRLAIKARLKSSAALAARTKGSTSLVLGVLGLGIGGLFGAATLAAPALAKLVGTSAFAAAWGAHVASLPSTAEKAAQAHYVAALR